MQEPIVPAGRGADELPWSRVDGLVRDAGRRYGDKEFLRDDEGGRLSFAGLERDSAVLAAELVRRGVHPGDRVALMMANSVAWPLTWLSIIRAGGIAVPVNKRYQATDLEFVLTDSGTRFIVAGDDVADTVEAVVAACCTAVAAVWGVDVRQARPELVTRWEARANPQRTVDEDSWEAVTNLQYTSGTTGFPKACVLTDAYWLRLGWLAAEAAEIRGDDVVLTSQPCSYIDPQWQTMMCLVTGATLVVLPRFSARSFMASVRDHGVTFIYVLGTMPVILYKQPETASDKEHALRMVLVSGMPPGLHAAFEQRWGVPWREIFGMTETGLDLSVPASATETVGTGAIGKPVATKQVAVAGPDGAHLPPGEVGELVVQGTPMLLRYHNRARETAETVVDGWLHTGDLVRQDEEGWVYIVGRLKDMVRRAGENIAAAEVEGVISKHDAVEMCAVVGVPDPVMEEEVKVFIKPRDPSVDRTEAARSIADYTRVRLASFKVPRFIEFVEEFPMTPSERISKPQLKRPDSRTGAFDAVEDRWVP